MLGVNTPNTLQVTIDWNGECYIGIHLRWDYNARLVHLFMPGYIQKPSPSFDTKHGVIKINLTHTHL
ncbi:hypothetical protein ACHAW6_000662 [Cyclotella cf. meneghiniana]